jgi:hypothetical protein
MGTIIKIVIAIILAVILLKALELAALAGFINVIGEGLKNSLTQQPIPVIKPTVHKAQDIILNPKNNIQASIREQQYLNENPDIMDMPPWEHENKWNRIYNHEQICWYHKKSMKKFCKSKDEK